MEESHLIWLISGKLYLGMEYSIAASNKFKRDASIFNYYLRDPSSQYTQNTELSFIF